MKINLVLTRLTQILFWVKEEKEEILFEDILFLVL